MIITTKSEKLEQLKAARQEKTAKAVASFEEKQDAIVRYVRADYHGIEIEYECNRPLFRNADPRHGVTLHCVTIDDNGDQISNGRHRVYYTCPQIAEIMKVNVRTVVKWIRTKFLKYGDKTRQDRYMVSKEQLQVFAAQFNIHI